MKLRRYCLDKASNIPFSYNQMSDKLPHFVMGQLTR